MSLEDDLRESLERRAGAVAPAANIADVHARATGRDRQARRLLVAGLAVALLAGPLVGFAAGRSLADQPEPTVSAAGPGAGVPSEPTVVSGADDPTQPTESRLLRTGEPLEQLFRRTTDDGIVIRAYRQNFCENTDLVVAGLSNEGAVTESIGATPGQGALSVAATGVFGVAEGSSAWWATITVDGQITRVRAESEGTTDEMEVVDGIAILAGGFTADTVTPLAFPQINVEGLDASGAVAASANIEIPSGVGYYATTTSCVPDTPFPPTPATLPPAGEPPLDADAARAEIEEAFVVVYDGTKTTDEKAPFLEAPTGLTDEQIAGGGFGQQVNDASAQVTDVVFTSPTTAAVSYDIRVENYSDFPGRIGEAVLVDGTWKVARVTYCQDLRLAGAVCPSG